MTTLDLHPRPSLGALRWLLLLHTLPLAALPFSMQAGPALYVIVAAVGLSWLWLRRHPALGFGADALTRLTWHAEGHWTVHSSAGAFEAQLLGNSLRHPRLLVLNFRLKTGARRTRILLGDELDEDGLRRLRVRLAAVSENGER